MRPFGVAGAGIDLAADGLELFVVLGEICQLGGAHKAEIGGIEEQNGPAAEQGLLADRPQLAILVGGQGEIGNFVTQKRHAILSSLAAVSSRARECFHHRVCKRYEGRESTIFIDRCFNHLKIRLFFLRYFF